MALKLLSRLTAVTLRVKSYPTAFSSSSGCSLMVEHDRLNRRFTLTPGSGAGRHDCAVLHYRFTEEKEVDLMSTYVPQTMRGQGVAALLSKAAMDFLVEENLKAHVSCWYIKKYIEEHPLQLYKERVFEYHNYFRIVVTVPEEIMLKACGQISSDQFTIGPAAARAVTWTSDEAEPDQSGSVETKA